ncbi:sensor histidine kinase [Caenimonas aquaedulcis]|uniref:histidine kinase n=1 Tax=Caenimonas aquaedulcis TaxID=2793270 RepID=A0A931H6B2_9BURK|nr:ATP-binding protein [Caenimonas aquaedulcis]MBG9389455.1 PAS domain-containing sensor histidine kinase [Caenimonas aquaedulcis]
MSAPLPGMTAATEPPPLADDSAFSRLWRGFTTARVSIAVVLLLTLCTLYMLVPALNIDGWLIGLCTTYLVATIAVRIFTSPLPPGRTFDPQWVYTIGIDLLTFSTLQFLQAGAINYSPLFALPVLMGSVLGSALLALATAAAVALLLLTDAWVWSLHLPGEFAARFLQAGLTGIGYFAVAFLANQLAARLAREELAARLSQQAARMQSQVNELVIETLADGVLVVDAKGLVHTANPAARVLLGMGPALDSAPFELGARSGWQPMMQLAQLTFAQRAAQKAEIAVEVDGASPRRMHVRTRLTPQEHQAESLCVMFMEDLREMEARLRTEKLAAMGRMSAAVAHEFRNPLAAIAQANELMEEDLHEPGLKQLSFLVRKNAQRLAQIVDEILDISRVQHQGLRAPPALELDAAVSSTCADWMLQGKCADRVQVTLAAPRVQVPFDADHLRRVLVNLLDNALRYAGTRPDSIRVSTHAGEGPPTLHVWSDGAPLEPSVESHLFEPFFSSESRSSGLGLYICRELCERHGAVIAYRRVVAGPAGPGREGNDFSVVFRAGGLPLAGAASTDTIAA